MDSIGIGSIKTEWMINTFLFGIALIVAIFLYQKKKNLILGIFTFSLLSNLIMYTDSGSTFFDIYNLKWVVIFTLDYWPWINLALFILLIINFIKNKYAKKIN